MIQNLLDVFNSIFGFAILFIMGFITASFLIALRSQKVINKELLKGGEEYGERATTKIARFSTMSAILSVMIFVIVWAAIIWYSIAA